VRLGEVIAISRALGQFHQRYDLFMTPTVATPPVVHEGR
jgi:Asp-tRNA(Asn)/Glu-tRNA(Gln) amidotransferase A subunit family amidase